MSHSSENTLRKIPEAQPAEPATPEELARASEAMKPELQAIAQQRLETMRQSVARHQTTLQAERGSWKSTFDRAKRWLTKEDSVETHLVKLNIEIDHLLDQIQNASADQVTQHLWKEVDELEKRCEQLVKIEEQLYFSPETRQETDAKFPVEMVGAMKPDWSNDDRVAGKLGRFGQDCMRIDREQGIAVVADGSSSGRDSYEVARRASRKAEQILQGIDEEAFDSLQSIQQAIELQLQTILAELNTMDPFELGATTLLAGRYLEKFDAVVVIDLGDCEGGIVAGNDFVSIKTSAEKIKSPPSIKKKQNGLAYFDNPQNESMVRTIILTELRQANPEHALHLLLTTDGLKNNSDKSLSDYAREITSRGVQAVLADVGSTKDDITMVNMTLPNHVSQRFAA